MTEWIDVHCHLNMLETDVETTLKEAEAAGVRRVVTIGTEPEDHGFVLDTARAHFPKVSGTLGVHPHEAQKYTEEVGEFILKHGAEDCICAVGELGLDYYYDNAPREVQKSAFRAQLGLAEKLGLPVQIHTRDADEDTVSILKEFEGRVTGIIHCFTGTSWLAEKCLELGYNISFSGIVTFKNAQSLREIASKVPIDRMHVETDSPFLTPAPHRGKKNSPARVIHTGQLVAELKSLPEPEFAKQMRQNALRMFPKIQW